MIAFLRTLPAVVCICAGLVPPSRAEEFVRVRVIENARQLRLHCPGYCRVVDEATGQTIDEGLALRLGIVSSRDGILYGQKRLPPGTLLRVEPAEDGAVSLNGRTLRGQLRISLKKRDSFTVINRIGLEDYLAGISVAETSHYWPMDALRAQAVVLRTYALYQKEHSVSREYDLCADVSSQVYAGAAAERYRFSEAVADTRGEVLRYQGKIIPAFFHSTCGGHTEDAAQLWSVRMPPLAGVLCPYCGGSPHFGWQATIPVRELSRLLLSKTRYAGSSIQAVEVVDLTASGRVKSLRIRTDKGSLTVSGKDLRSRVGADRMRSTLFSVRPQGTSFVFQGKGWGHGVGLCQWGSYFLAKSGADYKEILAAYYPQSELASLR